MTINADVEIDAVTIDIYWECPEEPERLKGAPLGMYHCPWCGCMQLAGLPHMGHEVWCHLGLWPDEGTY